MNFRRIKQVCQYGWKDAEAISNFEDVKKGKVSIFLDILSCYFKYNVWSNQYKKEKLYALDGEQRKEICLKYQEKNTFRDKWVKEFFDNYKFLHKWSSFKYETSASLQAKRRAAYKKQYGLGENCFIGYGVVFHRHHYIDAQIKTGNNCIISENSNIDYTGGLILGDYVGISENVKILTHNHVLDFNNTGIDKGCICTPLIIQDRAWIGTRATIMPGVSEIGRGAIISADTFVNKKVPPYAIVLGNPSKIVGFKFSPEEMAAYEEKRYPIDKRTDINVYRENYKKYFSSRLKEIKEFTKRSI